LKEGKSNGLLTEVTENATFQELQWVTWLVAAMMYRYTHMRFCFELDAIEVIEPWGEDQDRKPHWFGLTSGRYWISTPLGEALRYTDD
jgi:hypothetical protein